MYKKIRDYEIEDILLPYESVRGLIYNFSQQESAENSRSKNKELTISLLANILINLIAVFAAFSTLHIILRVIAILILAGLSIYTIVCATKWHDAYRNLKNNPKQTSHLEQQILEKAKESIRYTAIVRITYKAHGEILYLTGNDYFLPHCTMDENGTALEQIGLILQSLHDDYGIQEKHVLDIIPVDEGKVHFSIKPIHGSIQMNAFVFYDAKIKIQAKEKLIKQNDRRYWITLERMRSNPLAVSTNKDVIDLLDNFPKPMDSFVNALGNVTVIWNITDKCHYDCSICATKGSNRNELSLADKLKVLLNICTAKKLIKALDFAGGDPLYISETSDIIQTAIEQLGEERIAVTTTGVGVSKLSENGFSRLIKHCEITIDAAHDNLHDPSKPPSPSPQISRNAQSYCETNISQIHLILEHAESLTVNIPIINSDLSDEEIQELVSKITRIKNHNPNIEIDTLLIRLMPVGKAASIDKNTYKTYNPIDIAKKIKSSLEGSGIPCKLHCSLRALPCFADSQSKDYCTMLENKIGIDCAGNVFACAWGGYLSLPSNDPISKNPLYLGNLTETPLIDILEGASRTNQYIKIFNEISSSNRRHFCSVISYYAKKELFENYDYLAQEPDS